MCEHPVVTIESLQQALAVEVLWRQSETFRISQLLTEVEDLREQIACIVEDVSTASVALSFAADPHPTPWRIEMKTPPGWMTIRDANGKEVPLYDTRPMERIVACVNAAERESSHDPYGTTFQLFSGPGVGAKHADELQWRIDAALDYLTQSERGVTMVPAGVACILRGESLPDNGGS